MSICSPGSTESNLETLKFFAYKKPQLCFIGVKNLLLSQDANPKFWQKDCPPFLYSYATFNNQPILSKVG
jgi:hypothetical protein